MLKKILIAGYYGCGNVGDDLLLMALVNRLKSHPVELTVLSGNPGQTEKFCGIKSFRRMHFPSILESIKECNVLVFGGGSIFQDKTSIRSMLYYSFIIYLAKYLGKKVYLLGQGMGPVTTLIGRKLLKRALSLTDWVCVRDEKSYDLCRSLVPKLEMNLGADLAFLFSSPSIPIEKTNSVGISLRPYQGKSDILKIGEEILQFVLNKGYTPCWWIMHPEMDEPIINQLDPTHQYKRISLNEDQSPQEFFNLLGQSTYAVTMRLHAGIFALLTNITPLVLSYDPKVTAFAKQNNLEYWDINKKQNLNNLWEKMLVNKNLSIKKNQLLVEKQLDKFIQLLEL